jgi:hypothetical protein
VSAVSASPTASGSILDPVRVLQHALYRAAKADPGRRFHALRDKVFRRDVLWRAWVAVRRNDGAPGIDKTTLDQVEQYGVTRLLDELASELRNGSYRPLPARRVFIVRRVALRRIPCSAGRNLEGGFWVYRLTRCRKVDGTRACRIAVARWRHRRGARSDPRDMAKAGLLEVQSPLGEYLHPPERCLKPVPCHALAWDIGRRNLHGAGGAQRGHSRR